jgi:flagellar protein FlaG
MSVINSSTIDNVSIAVSQASSNTTKANSQEADTKAKGVLQGEITSKVEEQRLQQFSQSEVVEKKVNEVISPSQLEKVAQQLQDFVGGMNKGLEFLVDQDSGRDVIKVIDKNNGDLIKQYPSEEVLSLVAKLSEAAGSFINEKI